MLEMIVVTGILAAAAVGTGKALRGKDKDGTRVYHCGGGCTSCSCRSDAQSGKGDSQQDGEKNNGETR